MCLHREDGHCRCHHPPQRMSSNGARRSDACCATPHRLTTHRYNRRQSRCGWATLGRHYVANETRRHPCRCTAASLLWQCMVLSYSPCRPLRQSVVLRTANHSRCHSLDYCYPLRHQTRTVRQQSHHYHQRLGVLVHYPHRRVVGGGGGWVSNQKAGTTSVRHMYLQHQQEKMVQRTRTSP